MPQLFSLAVLLSLPLLAQHDPQTLKVFDHFYNLDYDQAIAELERAIAARPDSAGLHNHLAQCLQFRELYRVGALESELVSGNNSFLRRPKINTTPEIEKRFLAEIQKALDLSQARLARNPKDTTALYAHGVAYGLRANWNFLVRKAWRDALRDATQGRKLHNRVTELDPSFYDARLLQGGHDYVVGSLPPLYKMLGFLVGFRGDRQRGIRAIQEVAAKGKSNRIDAKVFLCALYRREQRWQDAEPLLAELIAAYPRNYLLRFEQAQMYGMTGRNERALAVLNEVAAAKARGAYPSLAPEKILYQLGNVQFWYRDYDSALGNFTKVAARSSEVDLNTGALAWLRIGQIHDLKGRRNEALAAYRKSYAFAPEAEAAKESRRYLASPFRRTDPK